MAGLEVSKPMLQSWCEARVLKVLVRQHGRFGVLELPIGVHKNSRQLLSVSMFFHKTSAFDRRVWFLKWIFMIHYALDANSRNISLIMPHSSPARKLPTMRFLSNRFTEPQVVVVLLLAEPHQREFLFHVPWGSMGPGHGYAWLHLHRTACMYSTDFLWFPHCVAFAVL